MAEAVTFPWESGTVSGLWSPPPRGETYLLLGHGAGGNMHTPGLAQFADALAASGVGTIRFNFPYAEAKRRAPDPQRRLEACFRAVVEQVRPRVGHLYLGGRSMGGRIASHVVADGVPAAGCVFLSYPLHPPGQPQRLRAAHLRKITVPMLFLQGTRDAFARPELLRRTLEGLPQATLYSIEGGEHGPAVRGRDPADLAADLARAVVTWMRELPRSR